MADTVRPMRGLLESVPNFSEGRDAATLDAVRRALAGHVRVLDVHADPDHNRSVFTCIGPPADLVEGLAAAIAVAAERIDLRTHEGVHPRVGVADVVPFVRFQAGDTEPEHAARLLGERVGALGIPVLGYGDLGGGRRPTSFRTGGVDALAARLESGEAEPLFGPAELHPTAGAVLLGVRPPLVAFNLELDTGDVDVARAVATAVRARDGGLPGVQALGLRLAGTGRAQVSMNLIAVAATPLHRVVREVERLAAEHGAAVVGGELVGLMPASVAASAAGAALRLPGLDPDRMLEVAASGEFGRGDR